jgi:Tol biopolymer transport system component
LALTPGTRLGVYEVIAQIGEGGMGQVYRARDTKLNRDVALKVLPDAFASDAERLARFTREAQTLASLNHANIAHIHGLEESGGVRALVMELVEGEDLSQRIVRGAIPIDEALPIARQIAEALEAAHEQGIIHRDLKPANIKLRPDGTIKVLDFGLAKAMEPPTGSSLGPSMSPTITSPAMTQSGTLLGTAAYMSPEQASGKPVDRRTDVWSFGVVLWEMLTGTRLFDAETLSHTLADVLRLPIEFDTLPPETPRAIRELLRRCLDRDVRSRLRDIGEARIVLENAANPARADGAEIPHELSRQDSHHVAWMIAAVLAFALGAGGFLWWRSTQPVYQPLIRLSVDLGPEAVAGARTTALLSPDGTRIVFPARGPNGVVQLATRTLDQATATPLSGTEGGSDAFFSPDAQWIGFFADGELKKVAVQGGTPVTLCDVESPAGGSWGEDGNIIFSPTQGSLMRVSSAGGAPQRLIGMASQDAIRSWPQVLPGGRAVLYTESTNPFSWEDADISVASLETGRSTIVRRGGYSGRYVPSPYGTGYLLYVHQGTLFAVRFDPGRLETSGTPAPLLGDVAGNATEGSGQFDASLKGSFVYVSGKAANESSYPIAWMNSSGKTAPLLVKPGGYGAPRFSPDGRRLVFTAPGHGGSDVWVYDLERDTSTQLTFTGHANLEIAWAPDGKHLVFGTTTAGVAALWWMRSDGSGEPQMLLERKNTGVGLRPQSFTPDGRRLAFDDNTATLTGVEIWTLPLDLRDPEHPVPGRPEPFLTTAIRQVDATFSPDGKWMAYSSNESGGLDEIFVRPFPGPGGKWRVSTGGGKFPMWSRVGRKLVFLSMADFRIMVANYTVQGDSFNPEKPRVWSDRRVLLPNFIHVLDLHPDGTRLAVFPRPDAEAVTGNLHVTFLLNFFDELRRRVPLGK